MVLQTDHDRVVAGNPEHQPWLVTFPYTPIVAFLAPLRPLAEVLRTRRRHDFSKLVGEVDGVDLDVIDVLWVLHPVEEVTQALLGLAFLALADEAVEVVLGRLLAQSRLEVWILG